MVSDKKIALLLPAENSINSGNQMICEATRRMIQRIKCDYEIEEFTFLRPPYKRGA